MATPLIAPWRFTVDEYYTMADAGIFGEDDRVELIDGEIVAMSAIGLQHRWTVDEFNDLLVRHVPAELRVGVQNPIRLGLRSEPEPDLCVFRRSSRAAHPTPEAILLLVEVADSSLTYDRRIKLPLYARAGIPEVWLADLIGSGLERHSDPVNGVYQIIARAGRGESLESLTLPGLVIQTDAVLGS